MSKVNYTDMYKNNYIEDRVYAVTGAGGGFGRLTTLEILKMGGKVAIMGHHEENTMETLKLGEEIADGNIVAVVGDAGNYDDVKKFVAQAVEKFGELDVFIANAGTMPLAPWKAHEKALEAWDRCLNTNLRGTMYGIAATYDQFIKQGRGHFVSISSIYGNFPVYGSGVYQATKIAVRYLVNSLRVESQGKIKTTIVNPTGVPATGLSGTVVEREGAKGICGQNWDKYLEMLESMQKGEVSDELLNSENVKYFNLEPQELVWGIMHALNQPWGVSVSDISMRASGELYIL